MPDKEQPTLSSATTHQLGGNYCKYTDAGGETLFQCQVPTLEDEQSVSGNQLLAVFLLGQFIFVSRFWKAMRHRAHGLAGIEKGSVPSRAGVHTLVKSFQ